MTTTRTPLLETRDLSGGYGGTPAIRNIDLRVDAGEVVVLLGPNGAGKSTTILTVAGELAPLAGEVLFDGEVMTGPMHRRVQAGVGLVTDDRTVFMGMTVAENLRLAGSPRARALELFPQLEPHMGRKVGLLSGGQQQMLSLARALAKKPKVLLADELSLGLAPIIVNELLDTVRAAADGGTGVLLVEQFARSALAIADRAYVLSRGDVVLEGEASALLKDFASVERAYLSSTATDVPG